MSTLGTAPRASISLALRKWNQMSDSAMRVTARMVVTHAISRNHATSRVQNCSVAEGSFIVCGDGNVIESTGRRGPMGTDESD
jgi:hypothetical protein